MEKIRKTYSAEFKMNIVDKYLNGGWSQTQLLQKYRIHNSMLQRWVNQYKADGIYGLGENRGKLIREKKVDLEKIH
jgi:transposase